MSDMETILWIGTGATFVCLFLFKDYKTIQAVMGILFILGLIGLAINYFG